MRAARSGPRAFRSCRGSTSSLSILSSSLSAPRSTFTTALPGQSRCSRAPSRRASWPRATELQSASAMTAVGQRMNLTLDISSVVGSGPRRVASRDGRLVALRAGAGAVGTCRAAAASLFIRHLGWTPKRVQTVMGHSTINTTFDLYGHLFEDLAANREPRQPAAQWRGRDAACRVRIDAPRKLSRHRHGGDRQRHHRVGKR
jgi:hypothetical protein